LLPRTKANKQRAEEKRAGTAVKYIKYYLLDKGRREEKRRQKGSPMGIPYNESRLYKKGR
jgi:hypothetical protein